MSEIFKKGSREKEEGVIFFLLLALASYRLTKMVAIEDGPFDIFLNFRGYIYNNTKEDSTWQKAIECPYCISWWSSLILYLMPRWFVTVMGISGAVSLLFDFCKEKIFR